MGLRLKEGIAWEHLEDSAGRALVRSLVASPYLKKLQESNVLEVTQSGIAASPKGRLQTDGIVAYLGL
jgi:coproporphyrinogen III oxidase-like Fe-S oxidoreductase